jgi:hypothetical protein
MRPAIGYAQADHCPDHGVRFFKKIFVHMLAMMTVARAEIVIVIIDEVWERIIIIGIKI